MRFIFRLQNLLKWKESLEEKSRLDLIRANYQLRQQQEAIRRFLEKRESYDQTLREKLEKTMTAWDYSIEKRFIEEGYPALVQMELEKREIERKVWEERARWTGFMKEKKVLERLRAFRFQTFLDEQEKREQKQLDEVALRAIPLKNRFSGDSD